MSNERAQNDRPGYAILELRYRCRDCGTSFHRRISPDNSLVRFIAGEQECWLPTYEKGGYFDLLELCLPGFRRSDEITMEISREFELRMRDVQHRPVGGGWWSVDDLPRCSVCLGRNVDSLSERLVEEAELAWFSYDPPETSDRND